MFGWFEASGPPKFNPSLLSPFAELSEDCLCAVDIGDGDDDLGGVIFGDRPLPVVDGYAYFEVRVEQVKNDDDDGLTVGVTTRLPAPFTDDDDFPGCADDVEACYCIGFDGRAKVEGADDLLPINFNPMHLALGDHVGFYVAPDGAACYLVNGRRMANIPGRVPIDVPLYPLIDLLGNCLSASLVQEAMPPEDIIRDFDMAQVRDDALDSLYTTLNSGDEEKMEGAIATAKLVGIDSAVIRSAQRSKRATRRVSAAAKKRASSIPASSVAAPTSATSSPRPSRVAAPAASGEPSTPTKKSVITPSSRSQEDKGARKSIRLSSADVKKLSLGGRGRASSAGAVRSSVATSANPSRKSPWRASVATSANQKPREVKTMLSDDEDGGGAAATRVAAEAKAQADAETAAAEAKAQADAEAAAAEAKARADAEAAAAEAKAQADAEAAAAEVKAQADAEAERAAAEAQERAAAEAKGRAEEEARIAAATAAERAEIEAKQREAEAKKAELLQSLQDALDSKDIARLSSAMADAHKLGVDATHLAKFERALKELEQELVREALREQKIKAMDDALATKELDRIEASLEEARSAGVAAADIDRVQQSLEKIKTEIRHRELVKAMDEAVTSEDIGQVKSAISDAENGGVDPAEIARVQQALRKLEADAARRAAEQALLDAIGKNDLDELAEAIAKAQQAEVEKDAISKAERHLADMKKRREEASKRLEDAMAAAQKVKPPTVQHVQAIEEAVVAAKALGIDTTKAGELCAALEAEMEAARQAARASLEKALANRDGEAIQSCMEECVALNAKEAVQEGLAQLRVILEEQLEAAKKADKEVRNDMVPGIEAMMGILRVHGDPKLRKLHNDLQDLKGALRVFCRVRPLNKREKDLKDTIAVDSPNSFTVTVTKSAKVAEGDQHSFTYDAIFLETNTQADVFSECQSLIQSAFDGYNVTIFTYGQTGAGKTWTLYGIPEQPGISPRSCDFVFQVMETYSHNIETEISCSMVELYNSSVRDLLSHEETPPKLDIRQEKKQDGTMAVKLDATHVSVSSSQDLGTAVAKGFGNRKVASTSMNADSSRSHLMFMIFLNVFDKESSKRRFGKITIVDLAGSERLAKSEVKGDAAKEAIEINKSLTALGDVMMAITSGSKMIPYRNHKLTLLMQDSLGGTAKTLMFVNISPAQSNADETINALKYASRARSIVREGGTPAKGKAQSAKDGKSRLAVPARKTAVKRSGSCPPP